MQPAIVLPLPPAVGDGVMEGKNAKQPQTAKSFAEILQKKNGCIANPAKDSKKLVTPVKAKNENPSLSGGEAVLSGPTLKVEPSPIKDAATTDGQTIASAAGVGSSCPSVSGENSMGSAQLTVVGALPEVAPASAEQGQDSAMPVILTAVPESSSKSASAAQPVIPESRSADPPAIPVYLTPPAGNEVNPADGENITSRGEALFKEANSVQQQMLSSLAMETGTENSPGATKMTLSPGQTPVVPSYTDQSMAVPEKETANDLVFALPEKEGANPHEIQVYLTPPAGNEVNPVDGENITSRGEALFKEAAINQNSYQQGKYGVPQKLGSIKQAADESPVSGQGGEKVPDEGTSRSVKVTAADLPSTKDKTHTPALAEKRDDGGPSTKDSLSNTSTGSKQDASDVPLDFRLKLLQVKPVGEEQLHLKENIDNVLKRLELMLKNGVSTARMVLKPEHLGSLTVSLVSTESGLVARFLVENHQAKAMLEGSMAAFRQQLEQNGVRVERLEVSLFNQTLGNGGQFFGQGNDRAYYQSPRLAANGYSLPGFLNENPVTEMPRGEKTASGYSPNDGVDYII